jgi:hypothetical protein
MPNMVNEVPAMKPASPAIWATSTGTALGTTLLLLEALLADLCIDRPRFRNQHHATTVMSSMKIMMVIESGCNIATNRTGAVGVVAHRITPTIAATGSSRKQQSHCMTHKADIYLTEGRAGVKDTGLATAATRAEPRATAALFTLADLATAAILSEWDECGEDGC